MSQPSDEAAAAPPRPHGWIWRLARLFTRTPVSDAVVTSMCLDAAPATVWQRLLSYEEVPLRPPLLLRTLLPMPLRTEGDKTRLGASVRCLYAGGDLVKKITSVDAPRLLAFDVVDQRLGIENCLTAVRGSYELLACAAGTEVRLTTHYRAGLRPRALWRPVEQLLGHRLHRHVLNGMCQGPPLLHCSPVASSESPCPTS